MPAFTSSDRRLVNTFDAAPSCNAKSSKRLIPLNAFLIITNFHLSANCSAAKAIGQSMFAKEERGILYSFLEVFRGTQKVRVSARGMTQIITCLKQVKVVV